MTRLPRLILGAGLLAMSAGSAQAWFHGGGTTRFGGHYGAAMTATGPPPDRTGTGRPARGGAAERTAGAITRHRGQPLLRRRRLLRLWRMVRTEPRCRGGGRCRGRRRRRRSGRQRGSAGPRDGNGVRGAAVRLRLQPVWRRSVLELQRRVVPAVVRRQWHVLPGRARAVTRRRTERRLRACTIGLAALLALAGPLAARATDPGSARPVSTERRRHRTRQRHRAGQEVAEPDRRPHQHPVPEQHQLQCRAAPGNAGDPQHPAGGSDPSERRLERHHSHHPAADLEPLAAARRDGAVRHRADHVLGVPLAAQCGRGLGVGRRPGGANPDDQQQGPRLQRMRRRPDRGARYSGWQMDAAGRRPDQQADQGRRQAFREPAARSLLQRAAAAIRRTWQIHSQIAVIF